MRRTFYRFNAAGSFGFTMAVAVIVTCLGGLFLFWGIAQRHFEAKASMWVSTFGTVIKDEMRKLPNSNSSFRDLQYVFEDTKGDKHTNTSIGLGFDGKNNADFPMLPTPRRVTVWYRVIAKSNFQFVRQAKSALYF